MKTFAEYDCKIPAYALSYLINDDNSGLEKEDVETIDNYMQQYYDIAKEQHGNVVIAPCGNEAFFTWAPDFGLACEVEDTKILILI
jgi:hypothetical protein